MKHAASKDRSPYEFGRFLWEDILMGVKVLSLLRLGVKRGREMPERTYKCWMCSKRGFKAEELVSHRCPECRAKRVMTVELDAQRAITPWVPEGQQAWVRFNGLGVDGGVHFRKRKDRISKVEAAKKLQKLNGTS